MNLANYLISGAAIFLGFSIHETSASTLVSGLWEDDYRHSRNTSEGWHIQRRFTNDNNSDDTFTYTTLPQRETWAADGIHYYGPFKETLLQGTTSGAVNYFQRFFKCTQPTKSVVLQYFTAGCAAYSHEGDRTEIWLNVDDRPYGTTIGYPDHGFDPYTGQDEDGYNLEDTFLQSSCKSSTHNDNFYWVQKHGNKWDIADYLDELQQNQSFRITIRIDADNDDLVMLFGITLECIESDQETTVFESNPENQKKSGSDAGVIIGTIFAVIIAVVVMCVIAKKYLDNRNKALTEFDIQSEEPDDNQKLDNGNNAQQYDVTPVNVEVVAVDSVNTR